MSGLPPVSPTLYFATKNEGNNLISPEKKLDNAYQQWTGTLGMTLLWLPWALANHRCDTGYLFWLPFFIYVQIIHLDSFRQQCSDGYGNGNAMCLMTCTGHKPISTKNPSTFVEIGWRPGQDTIESIYITVKNKKFILYIAVAKC